jgi:hypothetical protein
VYRWLSREMGITVDDCHLGKFDIGLCEAVIELCNQVEAGLMEGPRHPNGFTKKKWHKWTRKRVIRKTKTH